MKTIDREISFRSLHYDTTEDIETVRLELDDETISNIKWAAKLVKDNHFLDSVSVNLTHGNATHYDWEGNETTEWAIEVEHLKVYSDTFYYYAQNKYDSADQIETGGISIKELD